MGEYGQIEIGDSGNKNWGEIIRFIYPINKSFINGGTSKGPGGV